MNTNNFGQLWQHGPVPGAFYNFPTSQVAQQDVLTKYQHGSQRTSGPITTGTSVIAMKYENGVIIAADNLVSYGTLARYRNCDRVYQVNDQIVLGCGGDYADFQYIRSVIEQETIKDLELNDKNELKPRALFNWMTTYLYDKRCKNAPLYVDLVIGGIDEAPLTENKECIFLGHVSIRGKAYRDNVIATGFGTHLALPIMREFYTSKELANDSGSAYKQITKEEAESVTKKCMEVLYYRDCRAYSRYSAGMVSVEKGSNQIMPELKDELIEENWSVAKLIKGYN